jgi:hypothetical protein
MILKLMFLVAIPALVVVIFGIYPSLLGSRSARNQLQLRAKAGLQLRKLLRQVTARSKPNSPVRFDHTASGIKVEPIGPATPAGAPIFAALTGDTMRVLASAMPPRTRHAYRPFLAAWRLAPLVLAVVMIAVVAPALAQDYVRVDGTSWCPRFFCAAASALTQDYVRVDGTVQDLSGNHLTVISGTTPVWQIYEGQGYLVLMSLIVTVDLSQIPQSDSSFMRTGEYVTVIGVVPQCATGPCDGGDRVTATSLIRSQ